MVVTDGTGTTVGTTELVGGVVIQSHLGKVCQLRFEVWVPSGKGPYAVGMPPFEPLDFEEKYLSKPVLLIAS